MRLLIDAPILIWACAMPERLSTAACAALTEPRNDVFVSVASAREIAIKRALGHLEFPITHALAAGDLVRHHDDPFDRMLVAPARTEGLNLISEDAVMRRYDVSLFPVDPPRPPSTIA